MQQMLKLVLVALALCSAAAEQAQMTVKLLDMLRQSSQESGDTEETSMAKRAQQAILALDTNKDSVIDWHEVESFARLQGFNGAQAMKEFAAFDTNQDGLLDMNEVAKVLGTSPQRLAMEKKALEARIQAAEERQSSQKQQVQPDTTLQHQMAPRQMSTSPVSSRSVMGETSKLLAMPSSASKYSAGQTHQAHSQQKLSNIHVLANDLAEEFKMESDARELENMATTYHAQSEQLAQDAIKGAFSAAQVASKEKTDSVLASLQALEEKALHAEVQAAAMRAKAVAEAHKAEDLMAVAKRAMSRLRGFHA